MAGNKKPRKAYNPKYRGVLPVTIRHAEDHDHYMKIVPHQSFTKMVENEGDETTYANVIVRLNYGLEMAKVIFTEDLVAKMDLALNAMEKVRELWETTKVWKMTTPQAEDILIGLNATDLMQDNTSRRELREAMRTTFQKGAQRL